MMRWPATGAAWARRHPVAAAVPAGLGAVHLLWTVGSAVCSQMSVFSCVAAATLLVVAGSVVAIGLRAGWLAVATRRSISRLPAAIPSLALRAAADRSGAPRLRCLRSNAPGAFSAGLLRPTVYLTTGAVAALGPDELEAVLLHESAHAKRRDPLRRLLGRAVTDVLFYVPLTRWWFHRHVERTELRADRAAIHTAGRKAVAGALLTAADAALGAGTATAFGGATDARIAQLTGDAPPRPRPSGRQVIASGLGLTAAVWLMMCIAQATPIPLGL